MDGNVRELFEHAIGLQGTERDEYLNAACANNHALRAQVADLLEAHDQASGFLNSPTSDASSAVTVDAAPVEGSGSRIGPYKLLQLIGEGGFGSVFLAEQQSPVVRRVALKIIKLGMDTRQVVARFEQERQALALMDHPSIARVFDAGATATGRPYFVMELVVGESIVQYCDTHRLSINDRLELLAQVCQAVQHAHTKGIIHRDIKPSNILVTTQDGRPFAKVIDFGIAKATQSKLTEKTLFTEHRQFIGTPEYMSPEQAAGSLDIDTRTDVYSLGVLMYELLTGGTPFSAKTLRLAAYAELQRIIREDEPPKPSTRLSQNAGEIASVAASRSSEPRKLGALIRGELDWIVMKSLDKDRQRRYESANALAADIRRHLAHEAVIAAPPSPRYLAKKFLQRHRLLAAAGSAVFASLLIGVVATGFALARALTAESALRTQLNETNTARHEALNQAAIAEAVAKFQTDMLATADPAQLLGDKVTVVEAMQAAATNLDAGSLKAEPLVEAGVRDAIGNTLRGLARFDDAESSLRKSLELRSKIPPASRPDTARTRNALASLLRETSRPAEAEKLFLETVEMQRSFFPKFSTDLALTLNNFGLLRRDQHQLDAAEKLLREALELYQKSESAQSSASADCMNNLALTLQDQNKLPEAEALARQSLAAYRGVLPAGHPKIANSLSNLASVLGASHQTPEAERLCREALVIYRKCLRAGHPEIAWVLTNLSAYLIEQNKPAEAEPLLREALDIHRKALRADHPDIARDLSILGSVLLDQQKPAEAAILLSEALQIVRKTFPPAHPGVISVLINHARAQQELGDVVEARKSFDEAIATLRKQAPDGSPLLARALGRSGAARLETEGRVAALPELEEALKMAEQSLPPNHPFLKTLRETIAQPDTPRRAPKAKP
jgi:serine/threonine protein kinase